MNTETLRSEILDIVFHLALVPQNDPERTRFWQLASATGRELDRLEAGDLGDAGYLEAISTYHLVAMAFTHRLLAATDEKRKARQKFTRSERRMLEFTTAMLSVLTEGVHDVSGNLPKAPNTNIVQQLPARIRKHLVDLSTDAINADAKLIAELIDLPS